MFAGNHKRKQERHCTPMVKSVTSVTDFTIGVQE